MDWDEDKHLTTQSWNRKKKESKWPFYLLIAVVCFALAWMMSGAMK